MPICSAISSQVCRRSSNIDWFCSTWTLTFFTAALVMMKATTVGALTTSLRRWLRRCQRLDEHVHSLVAIFVAAAGEQIERVVQIERVAGEEVPHHEFVDALLVLLVQILEFVRGGEALDVQAVGQDRVGDAARATGRLRRWSLR